MKKEKFKETKFSLDNVFEKKIRPINYFESIDSNAFRQSSKAKEIHPLISISDIIVEFNSSPTPERLLKAMYEKICKREFLIVESIFSSPYTLKKLFELYSTPNISALYLISYIVLELSIISPKLCLIFMENSDVFFQNLSFFQLVTPILQIFSIFLFDDIKFADKMHENHIISRISDILFSENGMTHNQAIFVLLNALNNSKKLLPEAGVDEQILVYEQYFQIIEALMLQNNEASDKISFVILTSLVHIGLLPLSEIISKEIISRTANLFIRGKLTKEISNFLISICESEPSFGAEIIEDFGLTNTLKRFTQSEKQFFNILPLLVTITNISPEWADVIVTSGFFNHALSFLDSSAIKLTDDIKIQRDCICTVLEKTIIYEFFCALAINAPKYVISLEGIDIFINEMYDLVSASSFDFQKLFFKALNNLILNDFDICLFLDHDEIVDSIMCYQSSEDQELSDICIQLALNIR